MAGGVRRPLRLLAVAFAVTAALVFLQTVVLRAVPYDASYFGALEHGARPSSFNNFQARYAIRHAWTGPIDCKDPRRGVWGGRPGSNDRPPPAGATKLGLVPRTAKADLASYVRQDIPELGFTRGSSSTSSSPPSSSSSPSSSEKKGCMGCATTSGGETFGALSLFGLVVIALRRGKR